MRTPHSTFRRGKQVRLILRNGEVIISKFIERKGHWVVLESGEYRMNSIKSAGIYKPLKHEQL